MSAAIERLVAAGEDINEVEAAGCTPLHNAAFAGWAEGCALLLKLGAKVRKCRISSYQIAQLALFKRVGFAGHVYCCGYIAIRAGLRPAAEVDAYLQISAEIV